MSFIVLNNGMRVESEDDLTPDAEGVIRASKGHILLRGQSYFFTNLEIRPREMTISYPRFENLEDRITWRTELDRGGFLQALGEPYEPSP
jgi:hypothetical protein